MFQLFISKVIEKQGELTEMSEASLCSCIANIRKKSIWKSTLLRMGWFHVYIVFASFSLQKNLNLHGFSVISFE